MPYIVTTHTKRRGWEDEVIEESSSRAVATLDQARCSRYGGVADLIVDSALRRGSTEGYPRDPKQVAREAITESGGKIGPLPDGTTIEVKAVGWPWLAARVGNGAYLPEAQIIAAFNEAQG